MEQSRALWFVPLIIASVFVLNSSATHSVVESCGDGDSCVRFCCSRNNCSDETIYELETFKEAKNLIKNYTVLIGEPCDDFNVDPEPPWKFLKDGSISQSVEINGKTEDFWTGHDGYCLEKNGTEILILYCHEEPEEEPIDAVRKIYPILMFLSIPFLLATFLIYGCIKELRNLHGKCLMCYLFGMMCFFLSFGLIRVFNEHLAKIDWLCSGSGYVAYISTLVCFFWLNTMCYDMYSTFRDLQRKFSRRSRSNNDGHRFLFYCLYAFGCPILLSIGVYLADNTDYIPDDMKAKMGGEGRCWIQDDKMIELYYVFIPMSSVLFLNTVFYSITAYKIYRVHKDTSIIRGRDSNKNSNLHLEHERFFLYLRLFVVMGVSWIVEVISWYYPDSLFLHITDLLNCLQGIIIFISLVWKPRIKKLLLNKLAYTKIGKYYERQHSNKSDSSAVEFLTQTSDIGTKSTTDSRQHSVRDDQP